MEYQREDKSVFLQTQEREVHQKDKNNNNNNSLNSKDRAPLEQEGELSHNASSTLQDTFCLALNILGCFLYMMNYYIVHPSSAQYANALGLSDAMSGLIIGAMPWAAMFSSFAYSVWSNSCYRAPMLTSGIFLVTGNILYASAYRSESFGMALIGRFLTGLGGPKSMNRRYIADTTTLARRTPVNAAFGVATAMGSALGKLFRLILFNIISCFFVLFLIILFDLLQCFLILLFFQYPIIFLSGPAVAVMIDEVDVRFNVPLYGMVVFNGMTG